MPESRRAKRQRVALALSLLALVLWAVSLPAWTLRLAVLRPTFYQQTLRQSRLASWLPFTLSQELLARIPASDWSPWVARDAPTLRACLEPVFSPAEIEALAVHQGPAWARWALGEYPAPSLTATLDAYLTGPRGEKLRECFWATLPPCEADLSEMPESAICRPRDPADKPVVGLAQRAWWENFTADTLAWLAEQERAEIAPRVPPFAWAQWLWIPPVAALALTLLAVALTRGSTRWWIIAMPLLGGGVFGLTLGAAGYFGIINPWSVLPATRSPTWLVPLWPTLWHALGQVLGLFLMLTGALSLAGSMLWIFLAVQGRAARTGVLLFSAVLMGLAYSLLPLTPLMNPAPLPAAPGLVTATPWPTLTPTPTVTPTVPYWPVTPGTPWPTPVSGLSARAEIGGCFSAPEPALALYAGEHAVWIVGSHRVYRYDASRLLPVQDSAHPQEITLATFRPAGDEVALVGEEGVHFYALPAWERSLWSRVRTLSRSSAAVYVTGQDNLALGLDNGYVWVARASTGGIVWLLKSHDVPVTALAAHPTEPWVLSGAVDGTLQLWDLATGESRGTLPAHPDAARAVTFSADGTQALTADAAGQITLWDVARLREVRQYLLEDDAITRWAVTDAGVVGGTDAGALVWIGENLTLESRPLFTQPITALARDPRGALFVAAADGQVCVLTVTE